MTVSIAIESPLQDDVRTLVAELNAALLEEMADAHVFIARAEGLKRLVLETGDRHPVAWTVYERAGFTRCGLVLDYPASEWSVFYAKDLAP